MCDMKTVKILAFCNKFVTGFLFTNKGGITEGIFLPLTKI